LPRATAFINSKELSVINTYRHIFRIITTKLIMVTYVHRVELVKLCQGNERNRLLSFFKEAKIILDALTIVNETGSFDLETE
jgi:hypothetical protein